MGVVIVTKMNIAEVPLIIEVVKDTGVNQISSVNMRLVGRAAENTYLELFTWLQRSAISNW